MTLEQRQRKDLVLYSPSNCEKHSHKIKTIKDVLNLPSKTLGDFKRCYGKDWVIGYISMWLLNLNDNSNVKNKMGDAQIEFTATRIYESYSLKVTDLTLFFRNVKEGVYGQFYENLSQEKIMEWLSQYFDLRCEYAEMESAGNHEIISLTKDKINPKVIDQMFKGVGDEKATYDNEKNGLGSRAKIKYKRAKVITNRTDYLNKMYLMVKSMKTEDLKKYLVENDFNSVTYDEQLTRITENEIDFRNTIKK